MPMFRRDGIDFHYVDEGQGIPLVVQHGLGGDISEPVLLFQPPEGFRLLCLDARGHGQTRPLGDPAGIGIAPMADDLLALMDHLEISRAIVGGISMGAAIALNLALRYPDRLLGLILSRPAWLDRPLPSHLRIFPIIADLIQSFGPEVGLERFQQAEAYQKIKAENPDIAQRLVSHFQHPRAQETAIKFDRIPRDSPCASLEEWQSIRVPTLVLANRRDPIHPFEFGEVLARRIDSAIFRELTPKSVSLIGHGQDVRAALLEFLETNFCDRESS